ncbi:pyruvate dehydrogenase E1 component alpha subunit [Seinonella peptonophila]|uniref:Pyruvate dehydrogenase E1 component subunit alpha n=1 Tax=Seinonella peptonophila TaxID=112248 RepID=A0A1M5AKS1_9BACL|nr:pyruvate dehydrogenase (acetyl-transferring) E1 component subunit alpha [Seinonella peptonophila]SHF30861.1 pyruvate dehydrogenase E1 component alpha subunit [Seinonella peptonophila]
MKQCVTPTGKLTAYGEQIWSKLSIDIKKELWKWMVRLRAYDQQCMVWSRQGKILTYAPYFGQEASQVGSAFALQPQDWLFPTYRDHGAAIVHGLPMKHSLFYWLGRIEGNRSGGKWRALPASVPIATHLLHAVGTAWAATLRNRPTVSLALFGDGATSEGDFHEACNLAGLKQLPVLFFCQNNRYAISTPFGEQSATETVVEKAHAYGFPGIRIDGNDVLVVYETVKHAAHKARLGNGPVLIEALTYRLGPHTMSDLPQRYRMMEEEREWNAREPLQRYQQLLLDQGVLNEQEVQETKRSCQQQVLESMNQVLHAASPPNTHLFAHVFAVLPRDLKKQRNEVVGRRGMDACFEYD